MLPGGQGQDGPEHAPGVPRPGPRLGRAPAPVHGVVPHVEIGPNSIIAAKSGVTKSLAGNQMYGGYPARPIREQHKRDAIYNELVIMKKKLNKLTQT